MDCSIVLISYNTAVILDDCLASIYRSLEKSNHTCEIIVIDNASTDNTVSLLKKKYKEVVLIENKQNVGYGKANNQGIEKAKGTYIILLNSDTIVLNASLGKLLEYAKRTPKSFIGPKLLNIDRSAQTSCGPFFTLPVVFAALFLFGDRIHLTRWSPNKIKRVDWVSGACIIGKKDAFVEVKFDEQIFMYMDEIDFLYRAAKIGYKTWFFPTAQIVHIGAASSKKSKKFSIANIFRGMQFFYAKHYGAVATILLRWLLKSKAVIGYTIGILARNSEWKESYEEAFRMVK